MNQPNQNTEQKILKAAEDIFIQKGMSGARMQEIASHAGINKALLHYYYRSKEKLFLTVFQVAVDQFIPNIYQVLVSEELSLFDKIRIFVEKYTQILINNQFIPLFILHEINRNPDQLVDIITAKIEPKSFINQIQKEIDNENIRPIGSRELIVNMLSLTVFPVAAGPIMQRVLFNNNEQAYKDFLHSRAKEVPEFIIQSIKKA